MILPYGELTYQRPSSGRVLVGTVRRLEQKMMGCRCGNAAMRDVRTVCSDNAWCEPLLLLVSYPLEGYPEKRRLVIYPHSTCFLDGDVLYRLPGRAPDGTDDFTTLGVAVDGAASEVKTFDKGMKSHYPGACRISSLRNSVYSLDVLTTFW